jgi:trans-aconitate 2-methyltransferase
VDNDWDPAAYDEFRAERERPFFDLMARVPERAYARILDAGCGPGRLTKHLCQRWPEATVTGVDRSAAMIRQASAEGAFTSVQADLATWTPPQKVDLLVANASLHWLDDHRRLLPRLRTWLTQQGVMAVQMPDNPGALFVDAVNETIRSPTWNEALAPAIRNWPVLPLSDYSRILGGLGARVETWETTYSQRVGGRDGLLRWLEGAALRPYLALLGDDDRPRLLAEVGAALAARGAVGDTVDFRRVFFVADWSPA